MIFFWGKKSSTTKTSSTQTMISNQQRNMIPKPTFGFQSKPAQHHHHIQPTGPAAAISAIPTFSYTSKASATHSSPSPLIDASSPSPQQQEDETSLLNKLSFQMKLAKFQSQVHAAAAAAAASQATPPGRRQSIAAAAAYETGTAINYMTPPVSKLVATAEYTSSSSNNPVVNNGCGAVAAGSSNGFTLTLNQSSSVHSSSG